MSGSIYNEINELLILSFSFIFLIDIAETSILMEVKDPGQSFWRVLVSFASILFKLEIKIIRNKR